MLEGLLTPALLIGVRTAGILTFAPFFGSAAIPARVKAALVVVLTSLLYPVVHAPQFVAGAAAMPWLAARELMVGLLTGLTLQFVFDGFQMAGEIVGFQLGFSLANVIDPNSQVDTPVLSIFHQMIATLIFLQLDVHHAVLRGLARSFAYLPLGTTSVGQATAGELLRLGGGIWLVAVQIAAPTLAATLVADVALAFLGKAATQLPVLFVGLSVKSVLGYAVLLGSVAFWPRLFGGLFEKALISAERLLRLAV